MIPARRFLRTCRQAMFQSKVVDTTGRELSGGRLLLLALIVHRVLKRTCPTADAQNVGILLPPSIGAVLANAAISIDRRVSVNLNYTWTVDVLNRSITRAHVRHVITSRVFLAKLKLEIDARLIFIEDILQAATWLDYSIAAFYAYVFPISMLEHRLALTEASPDDLMTLIFTSGTTGEPKGVMLSHNNIASNVAAAAELFQIVSNDAVLGILPFFHSYGFTGGLWLVLILPVRGVYHYSPLDAEQIGRMCQQHQVTILMAAPTFLRLYLRRCDPDQFRTLNTVVVGAEKLPPNLAQAFQQKFNVRPFEAYGTTELSPMAAINVPAQRTLQTSATSWREGTVGRAIPGTNAKIVNPETFTELSADEPGMLLIQGPNVMLGYLDEPEKTAAAFHGGWYVTGDIASIDAEGFITILDRASRFSKIGGEMVPHIKIEQCLQQILFGQNGTEIPGCAVTAVADAKRGERLIVLHTVRELPVDNVLTRLAEMGLPNLWLPTRDSFMRVDEIPCLASGKLDLQRVRDMATKFVKNSESGSADDASRFARPGS